MPQGPLALNIVNLPNQGVKSKFNITAATVVKAAPGTILSVMVQVPGTTTGTVNDCLTTGAAAIGNQIAVIPDAVGPVPLADPGFPCLAGIVVVPGAGQTLAVSYQ